MFWTVATADALCLLLLAPLQGHRSGYLLVGKLLLGFCGTVREVAPCRAQGHLRGCHSPGGLGRASERGCAALPRSRMPGGNGA